jgi:hypothetical protein
MSSGKPVRYVPSDCWTHILSFIIYEKKNATKLNPNPTLLYVNRQIHVAYKNAIIQECQKKFGHLGLPRDFKLSYCLLRSPELKIHWNPMLLSTMRRAFELNCAVPLLEQILETPCYEISDDQKDEKRFEFWKEITELSLTCPTCPEAFDMICCKFAENNVYEPYNYGCDLHYKYKYLDFFSKIAYQSAFDSNDKMLNSVYRLSYPSRPSTNAIHIAKHIARGAVDGKQKKLFEHLIGHVFKPPTQILVDKKITEQKNIILHNQDAVDRDADADDQGPEILDYELDDDPDDVFEFDESDTDYLNSRYQNMINDILIDCCKLECGTVDQIDLLAKHGAVVTLNILCSDVKSINPDMFCHMVKYFNNTKYQYINIFEKETYLNNVWSSRSPQIIRSTFDIIPKIHLQDEKNLLARCCARSAIRANDILLTELYEKKFFSPKDWIIVLIEVLCQLQKHIININKPKVSWKHQSFGSGQSINHDDKKVMHQLIGYTGTEFKKGTTIWKDCYDSLDACYMSRIEFLSEVYRIDLMISPEDRHRCTYSFMNSFRKTFFSATKKKTG